MKKSLFTVLLFLYATVAFSQYIPLWQEGYLDIHNIATGKGDATFIVMPDGTKMLIDAGDMTNTRFICPAYPSDTLSPAAWIARYIKHFSKGTPGKVDEVDYFSLTHFHSDHFGSPQAIKEGPNYGKCGIMELGDYIKFDKFVDRAYPDYDFPTKDYILNKVSKKEEAQSIDDYIKFIGWQVATSSSTAEGFQIGSHKQFALKHKPKTYRKAFDIWNIAANGYITSGHGKGKKAMFVTDPAKLDENMFSTAILLKYGKFKYYNGGDIGGGVKGRYSSHRDFESPIADLIGEVTVMKADHHAWMESLNPYFLWKTRPQAIVVQCSHINHPRRETVQRIFDPQMAVLSEVYVTTDAGREQVGEDLFSRIKPAGHIVIRVYEGGSAYQIFVLDNKSTDYHIIYQTEVRELK